MLSTLRVCWILILCCVLLGTITTAVAADPAITHVAPNPVTTGNIGEFVVLDFPTSTNMSGWMITDGTHTAALPNKTVSGSIAVSADPRYAILLTDEHVVAWDGYVPLSAAGDSISLVDQNGNTIDTFTYPQTADGNGWTTSSDDQPRAYSGGEPIAGFPARDVSHAKAIILPDDPVPIIETLRGAEDKVWIAGYELTDPHVEAILHKHQRAGVDVRVLIDGQPVGGQEAAEPAMLDRLTASGIDVRVLTGEHRRYQHYHPKYAIIDETAIILSENWKPAGTGGASSRGWGIIIDDTAMADDLSQVFHADAGWRDSVSWDIQQPEAQDVPTPNASPMSVDNHPSEVLEIERAEIVVGPYQTEDRVLTLIEHAEERIDIQQMRISDVEFPPLAAAVDAARRGVSVHIHLDSTWYVREDNEAIADHISNVAERENIPIEATIDDPSDRYDKIHNKGMIIDDETVVIGSMNWNNVSMRENREVVTIIEGEEAARYYREVFDDDWEPPDPATPLGYLVAVGGLWIIAGYVVYRRVTFAHVPSGT